MTTQITSADLHALFEPIRAFCAEKASKEAKRTLTIDPPRDVPSRWEWWPEVLVYNETPGYMGWLLRVRPDDVGLSPLSPEAAASLILAAGLVWLAEDGPRVTLEAPTTATGMWSVGGFDPSYSGPTPYHALAAALRAVLGMPVAGV